MSPPPWDTLFVDARLARMTPNDAPYGAIDDGAIAIAGDRIAWIGPRAELPAPPAGLARRLQSLGGRWVTPGLIDCHTHLVYAGNRAREFEQRLGGVSYDAIARAGGGIRATVSATAPAGEEALVQGALGRLDHLCREGVTTLEVKSGYGLTTAAELKMLRAARILAERRAVRIVTSLLAAHTLPEDARDDADGYIDQVCRDTIPEAARSGLADAVDAFCEGIGFTPAQVGRVFAAAHAAGLPVKLHADQLSNLGGAALAARHHALSADHLEYADEDGVAAMADAGTVAVLLPGAFYSLGETRRPPVELFRRHKVPMAIATDCNPGSSPTVSLLLMLNMACTLFRLTPEEALAGVTRNAAQALGLLGEIGTLETGKGADIAIWDIDHPAELAYMIGANPCHGVIQAGRDRHPPADTRAP